MKLGIGTGVFVISDWTDFGVGAPILLFNMDESKSYRIIEWENENLCDEKYATTEARLAAVDGNVAFRFIIRMYRLNWIELYYIWIYR